jgi:hypothetical protein
MSDPTRRSEDHDLDAHASRDSGQGATPGATGKPALSESDKDTVRAASAPATAAAGAIAGATAGLATGAFGPIGAMVGAIVGALGGGVAGAAGGQAATDDLYTAQHDSYYRTLWEGRPERPADRTFESARAAYQFGHIAAQHPDYGGRHFADVEPELRRRWPDELRSRVGEWDVVRPYVEDAYGHARSRGVGDRRDPTVIGTAGSAVDPVERDRARRGEPSVDEPRRS